MAFISSGYDPKEPMKNRITDIGPRKYDEFYPPVIAKNKGKAVGIVTSVAIDDATPACFYGHAGSRNERDQLLEQAFGGAGLDVFMCGGVMSKGWNSETIAKKCESAGICYLSAGALAGFSPAAAGGRRVFGCFDPGPVG